MSDVHVLLSQLKDQVQLLSKDCVVSNGKNRLSSRIKILAVGDGCVGKTSLLMTYVSGKFPPDYIPTVFENHIKKVTYDKYGDVMLHLWDTAGQEDYDRLRPLSYPGADIVLLCFSVTNRSSFDSIQVKWYPEILHYIGNTPIILVGTKIDLRDSENSDVEPGTDFVSTEDGEKMASTIESISYVEVSSKNGINLNMVFEKCIEHIIESRGLNPPVQSASEGEYVGYQEDNNVKSSKKHRPDKCLIF